jgi:UDP-N-acetylglucosamine 2-epimerase
MKVCLAAGTRPEVITLAPQFSAFARGGRAVLDSLLAVTVRMARAE